MPPDRPLTLEERFPLLTPAGAALYQQLHEHPHAPRFNHRCGDRLTPSGRQEVLAWEAKQLRQGAGWSPGEPPAWVAAFAERCLAQVPHYRRRGGDPEDLLSIPTSERSHLSREPWSFVPDDQELHDLILYHSSGTTGHPMTIPCHPVASNIYLPLTGAALARYGLELPRGDGVAMVLICAQRTTFTFAVISGYLEGAAFLKVNLNPADWADPRDAVAYLEDLQAPILSGDPISFSELLRLQPRLHPRALISTALALTPGLRRDLETYFQAPVIDLYSMSEAGNIGVAPPGGDPGRYEILPHDLYVEILDEAGSPQPPGVRGEITLTGGRNPFLPLLRYRTGDFGALEFQPRSHLPPLPVLTGVEGRPPTTFRTLEGRSVNNIDVTWAMQQFSLAQYALHQYADGRLRLRVRGQYLSLDPIRNAVLQLFGGNHPLEIEEIPDQEAWGKKLIQYTREDAPSPGSR